MHIDWPRRTFVFEFPQSEVLVEDPIQHDVIFEEAGIKAAIVCDLPGYFEKEPADSLHFDIDVSLRAAVHSTYARSLEQLERATKKLFWWLRIHRVHPDGVEIEQCFTIDQMRDGVAIIEEAVKEKEHCLRSLRPVAHGQTSSLICIG